MASGNVVYIPIVANGARTVPMVAWVGPPVSIAAGSITLSDMATLAANSILGNNTGSDATPIALNQGQVQTFLGLGSAAYQATSAFDAAGAAATAQSNAETFAASVASSARAAAEAYSDPYGSAAAAQTNAETYAAAQASAAQSAAISSAEANAAMIYAPLASPGLTGTPTAPTAAGGTNTTQLATTAFATGAAATAQSACEAYSSNASNLSSGTVAAACMPALTGDVTSTVGTVATSIAAGVVTLAKMANANANTLIGNPTGSAATPSYVGVTAIQTMLELGSAAYQPSTAFSPLAGSSSLATVGTIGAGTWQGSPVQAAYVGALPASQITSGQIAPAQGGLGAASLTGYLYGNGAGAATSSTTIPSSALSGTISRALLGSGTTGQSSAPYPFLRGDGSWSQPAFADLTGIASLAQGGTAITNASGVGQGYGFMGPASGGAGAASWRALVAGDIPSLSGTYLSLSGGTMSGALTLFGTTTLPNAGVINAATSIALQGGGTTIVSITSAGLSLAKNLVFSGYQGMPIVGDASSDAYSSYMSGGHLTNPSTGGCFIAFGNSNSSTPGASYIYAGSTSGAKIYLVDKTATTQFTVDETGATCATQLLTPSIVAPTNTALSISVSSGYTMTLLIAGLQRYQFGTTFFCASTLAPTIDSAFTLRHNNSNAYQTILAGGMTASNTNGALATLNGITATNPGFLDLAAGAVSGAMVRMIDKAGNVAASTPVGLFQVDSNTLNFPGTGLIQNAGTTVLSVLSSALSSTIAIPAASSSAVYGYNFVSNSSGTGSGNVTGLLNNMPPGYTGTAVSSAFYNLNQLATTGASPNYGILNYCTGASAVNVGLSTQAYSGTKNIGLWCSTGTSAGYGQGSYVNNPAAAIFTNGVSTSQNIAIFQNANGQICNITGSGITTLLLNSYAATALPLQYAGTTIASIQNGYLQLDSGLLSIPATTTSTPSPNNALTQMWQDSSGNAWTNVASGKTWALKVAGTTTASPCFSGSGTGGSSYGLGTGAGTGNNNSWFGQNAGGGVTTCHDCTAIGVSALYGNTANYCTAIGGSALYNNTVASCTATGYYALYNNTGTACTATGVNSLYNNTGSSCTAVGYNSLFSNTGSSCTSIGYDALYNNTGNNCTAIGWESLFSNTFANCIAIGYSPPAPTAANQVYLGNSTNTDTYFGGANLHSVAGTGLISNEILKYTPGSGPASNLGHITLAALNTACTIAGPTVAGNSAGSVAYYKIGDSQGNLAVVCVGGGAISGVANIIGTAYSTTVSGGATAPVIGTSFGLQISAGALQVKVPATTYPTGYSTSSWAEAAPTLVG